MLCDVVVYIDIQQELGGYGPPDFTKAVTWIIIEGRWLGKRAASASDFKTATFLATYRYGVNLK